MTRALSKAAPVVRCGESMEGRTKEITATMDLADTWGQKALSLWPNTMPNKQLEKCWMLGGFSMIKMVWHMHNVYAVSLQHVSKDMLSVSKSNMPHGTAQLVFFLLLFGRWNNSNWPF